LSKLQDRNLKKGLELWKNGLILHWDNASLQSELLIWHFLDDRQIPALNHTPHIPQLTPCDFFLFPQLKCSLKETNFQSTEDTELLKELSQNDFQRSF
jgi:hypothetical protein